MFFISLYLEELGSVSEVMKLESRQKAFINNKKEIFPFSLTKVKLSDDTHIKELMLSSLFLSTMHSQTKTFQKPVNYIFF